VLVDHELRVALSDVVGDPDPEVGYRKGKVALISPDSSPRGDYTAERVGSVLDGVLTQLRDSHLQGIADEGDVIEVIK
jgi:hypothetical protein